MVKLVNKLNFLFSTAMSSVPKEQTQWKFLSLTVFWRLLTADPYSWGQTPIPLHFFQCFHLTSSRQTTSPSPSSKPSLIAASFLGIPKNILQKLIPSITDNANLSLQANKFWKPQTLQSLTLPVFSVITGWSFSATGPLQNFSYMASLEFQKWQAFTAASSLVRHEQNIPGYTVQKTDGNVIAFENFTPLINLAEVGWWN